MSKTGGGIGTNQYRLRGRSRVTGSGLTVSSCTQVPSQATLYFQAMDPNNPPELLARLTDASPDTRAMVASNPSTSASTLVSLASDDHTQVLISVAAHPNTPPATLILLARQASDRLAKKALEHVRRSLVHNPRCPPEALDILAGPLDILHNLQTNVEIMENIGAHSNTALDTLQRMATSPSLSARYSVAKRPYCPPNIMKQLVRDSIPAVLLAAVTNPTIDLESLAILVTSNDEVIRRRALANPQCPDYFKAIAALGAGNE